MVSLTLFFGMKVFRFYSLGLWKYSISILLSVLVLSRGCRSMLMTPHCLLVLYAMTCMLSRKSCNVLVRVRIVHQLQQVNKYRDHRSGS
jgi:hypothetical protein